MDPGMIYIYNKHFDLLIQEYQLLNLKYQIQRKDLNYSIRYLLRRLRNYFFKK